ncbi:MAG: c-type cytochrome [Pyrinomonadaceae bacterium]|nr:c-type cytochrome [Pyrinomonadaceae bacterium]
MGKAQDNKSASRLRRWSRRLLKIAIYGISGVFVIILILITVTIGWRPFFGPKSRALVDRKFEATEARLARGQYLTEGPLHCFQCHSEPDHATPGAPALAGTKGGGRIWKEEGFPWLVTPNITPDKETGAGNWTDDMMARAIREGVGHDGRALFPLMPYKSFSHLSDEDLASVIAYVRSIEPVRTDLPKTKAPFAFWLLGNVFPEPLTTPVPQPDVSTPVKRGEYLAQVSDCAGCHTPRGRMTPTIPGMEFAGGNVFGQGDKTVAVANITPDASGISYYDEALFLQVMRTGHVKARRLDPVMPWVYLRNMTDEDMTSLYAYLRTLKPVSHVVDNTEPPTDCRLCKQKHGYGDRN